MTTQNPEDSTAVPWSPNLDSVLPEAEFRAKLAKENPGVIRLTDEQVRFVNPESAANRSHLVLPLGVRALDVVGMAQLDAQARVDAKE